MIAHDGGESVYASGFVVPLAVAVRGEGAVTLPSKRAGYCGTGSILPRQKAGVDHDRC